MARVARCAGAQATGGRGRTRTRRAVHGARGGASGTLLRRARAGLLGAVLAQNLARQRRRTKPLTTQTQVAGITSDRAAACMRARALHRTWVARQFRGANASAGLGDAWRTAACFRRAENSPRANHGAVARETARGGAGARARKGHQTRRLRSTSLLPPVATPGRYFPPGAWK